MSTFDSDTLRRWHLEQMASLAASLFSEEGVREALSHYSAARVLFELLDQLGET